MVHGRVASGRRCACGGCCTERLVTGPRNAGPGSGVGVTGARPGRLFPGVWYEAREGDLRRC